MMYGNVPPLEFLTQVLHWDQTRMGQGKGDSVKDALSNSVADKWIIKHAAKI